MHADPLSVYLHCINNANICYSYNSFLTGVFIIHITEHITQKSVDVKATWLCDFFCVHVCLDEICQITRITHQSCLNDFVFEGFASNFWMNGMEFSWVIYHFPQWDSRNFPRTDSFQRESAMKRHVSNPISHTRWSTMPLFSFWGISGWPALANYL